MIRELTDGGRSYWDPDRIRKHDGLIYSYRLYNRLIPEEGAFSSVYYEEIDCENRISTMYRITDYEQQMGLGRGSVYDIEEPFAYHLIKDDARNPYFALVCDYVNSD